MDIKSVAEHVEHTLRGKPRFSVISICNAAGVALWNAHDWMFTTMQPALLSATAGQSYIDLPDAREILEIQVNDSPTGYRVLVGHRQMLALRRGVYAILEGYEVMLSYRQPTGGGAPVRVLEMHPTPAEAKADLFRIWYRSEWARLDDDDDKINIPYWMEPTYLEFVRAYAHGWHYPENGTVDERLSVVKQGSSLMDAMQVDGTLVSPIGILAPSWTSARDWDSAIIRRNING